ncbi:NADH oxidase [Coniophora puteana RWD-64-598 SS2]|uniref:NADH oxidase n=1 Tax=Coniophora puteana (strain RWD-64-598) TaxID=741705 RepID=A0A5M3MF27_CONPW|nr:NADH oxidase [Coniophora puteana RWD-64-598 SS2]EIW77753.1 NADH oxidase [Coniophora puteana RWD-64-598 SS2]
MTTPQEVLGEPITFPFSGKTAKNRFLKSAMSERLATFSTFDPYDRGRPTEELARAYETWSNGNIGILVTGNIQVKKDHLEATGNAIIDNELPDYIEDFRRIAQGARTNGSLILGQLCHPGRQVPININPYPESASDVELVSVGGIEFGRPIPLARDGIKDIVDRFAYAASVLHQAGFDGVQVQGGHGYLINQFLSKRTNRRTDEYGGSLLNRSRLLFDVLQAIKSTVKDSGFMISVKLNADDFVPGGFSADEAVQVARALEQRGVDLIELSGGTYEHVPEMHKHKRAIPADQEAYFINYAKKLRSNPGLRRSKIVLTGGFRSATAMAIAVAEGHTDLVGMARPFAAEPFLALDILKGLKTGAKGDKFTPGQWLRLAAAGHQIAEIGNGVDVTDFDNFFEVSRFVAKMQGEIPEMMAEALSSDI